MSSGSQENPVLQAEKHTTAYDRSASSAVTKGEGVESRAARESGGLRQEKLSDRNPSPWAFLHS